MAIQSSTQRCGDDSGPRRGGRHSSGPSRDRPGRHARPVAEGRPAVQHRIRGFDAAPSRAAPSRAVPPSAGPRRRVAVLLGSLAICAAAAAAAVDAEVGAPVHDPDRPVARAGGTPSGRPVATAFDRAVAELAGAVARDADVPAWQARCVARRALASAGLDRLVAAGVVASDGRFLDPHLGGRPSVRKVLRAAAAGCR